MGRSPMGTGVSERAGKGPGQMSPSGPGKDWVRGTHRSRSTQVSGRRG